MDTENIDKKKKSLKIEGEWLQLSPQSDMVSICWQGRQTIAHCRKPMERNGWWRSIKGVGWYQGTATLNLTSPPSWC